MPDEFYTPAEVAVRLKSAKRTVLEWLRQGKLRGVKVGGQWRIPAAALESFPQEPTRQTPPIDPLISVDKAIAPGGLCTRMSEQDQLTRESDGREWKPPTPTD